MNPSDQIIVSDLEVNYRVGVPDEERARPQRLLITLALDHDFRAAAKADDLNGTIDYDTICQRLLWFGEGRSWKLIETLASDIAAMVLDEFKPQAVSVTVKKFIIPAAQYIAVVVRRTRRAA
jgi:FolB domain-containing protein